MMIRFYIYYMEKTRYVIWYDGMLCGMLVAKLSVWYDGTVSNIIWKKHDK